MQDLSGNTLQRVDELCEQFVAALHNGSGPRIEEYVERHADLEPKLFVALLQEEIALRRRSGAVVEKQEYLERFPGRRADVAAVFDGHRGVTPDGNSGANAFPSTTAQFQSSADNGNTPTAGALTSSDKPEQATDTGFAAGVPERIGRYLVQSILGEGGFGRVYLACDDQLKRAVAIKVPHARLVAQAKDAELYLAEARTVAGLDHAHIVPVYDVSSTAECPFFVVSKYVEGSDLASKIKQSRLSWTAVAELVATVADALHYAHKQGLVHRDVKPGNILIDNDSKPYIVDFGLALREENLGQGPRFAGTPAYMSPEQARGEGHRVDGRSDIFSLGIVLYELLVGRRPFLGTTSRDLLEQITTLEARPPRMIDDSIPKELERICLKALSKRATERYTTACDLAEELRHFSESVQVPKSADNLLHLMWDHLDSSLQDAFSLAYNKKRRQGGNRISTKDFFQALARLGDDSLRPLIESLPEGALPDPVDLDVPWDRRLVLEESPLLSDCVEDSLEHFRELENRPRRISPADVFVDIAKHGHGPSVARLREHGVGEREIEEQVDKLGLSVLRRRGG